jgi:transposase
MKAILSIVIMLFLPNSTLLKGMAMKKRISNKQNWFKKFSATEKDWLFVGMDVHKKSHHVAIWIKDKIDITFVMPANNEKVVSMLKKLRPALKMVAYEAGPTGYGLARAIEQAGMAVLVAAPSKTPRQSAVETKCDRLDCRKLAEYAAKGLLKSICIPTQEEEADRQLVRLRDQLAEKRRRVKQQIKSFMLQHGIKEPYGLVNWSISSKQALRRIVLCAQLRICLDTLLDELDFIEMQIGKTMKQLRELFGQQRHSKLVEILRSHPAVGEITAWNFIVEINRPWRFKKATELGKYVGLCPRVSQSGQTRRDGPIMKTGRRQLRSKLVEISWRWKATDERAGQIYHRLLANTGCAQKAIVGLARHMAIDLWRMLCTEEYYRKAV